MRGLGLLPLRLSDTLDMAVEEQHGAGAVIVRASFVVSDHCRRAVKRSEGAM